MNFVESLSLSSGLKASRPFIDDAYFPVVPQKYITFHTENHQSKQWDHFQEWINIIKPHLDKKGIDLIELGWNNLQHQHAISLKNAVNVRQASYILKNSLAHIGPENILIQLASYHHRPFIALFSNTTPQYAEPLWSPPDSPHPNQFCISAPRGALKPSYMAQENPKLINSITAEEVAAKTLDILEIPHDLGLVDPVYTGNLYHTRCVEVVPDFVPSPRFFPKSLLNIRMDYHFHEEALEALALNRKLGIVTDKNINLNLIKKLRPSIEAIFFKINETTDTSYIKELKRLGLSVPLIAHPTANLPETRLNFFDWAVEEEENKTKKCLDNCSEICDTTRYKSSKKLFSKNIEYSSKSAWKQQIKSHEHQMIIDEDEFWSEVEHFKLYNIKDNG